jgi:hypothetical protein
MLPTRLAAAVTFWRATNGSMGRAPQRWIANARTREGHAVREAESRAWCSDDHRRQLRLVG